MITILLVLILIVPYLLYRKITQFLDLQKEIKENFSRSFSFKDQEYTIKDWLSHIHKCLMNVDKNTALLSDHFTADNPAGIKSDKYKKIENLIKIYAKHLVQNKNLTEKNALIRARFEVYEFGEEKIADEIDRGFMMRGVYWTEKDKAEKDFYASGILEKDVKEFWTDTKTDGNGKRITPYYLMEPIYDVIVKQRYQDGQEIYYADVYDEYENYYGFVRDRAIIYNLEKLGIIKKTDKTNWEGKAKYIIPNTNITELKRIIYEGEESHEDDYFEKQYAEGKLKRLFY